MKRRILLSLVVCTFSFGAYCQSFIPSAGLYSGKKIAYITLEDGTKVEGTIDDIDRKKGLVEEITIKPTGSKKKKKYKAEAVKSMYLPISGLENLGNRIEQVTNISKFSSMGVNMELINKGYAYLETTVAKVKRKNRPLLLQLLNPAFSSKIKVYNDPTAGTTSGHNIGGLQLTGGDAKSYYVQVGDEIAEQLKSKKYKSKYAKLFEGCPGLVAKIKVKPKWAEFDKNVYEYTTDCE